MTDEALFSACIQKSSAFLDSGKAALSALGCRVGVSPECCLRLFEVYQKQSSIFAETDRVNVPGFSLTRDGEGFTLSADGEDGGQDVQLSDDAFFAFLALVSDCFLPVYPLGTVVRLRKEVLANLPNSEEVGAVEILVTDRFLVYKDLPLFFPYGGVVYPVGMFEPEQRIQFGPQLVESVIFKGYSDEKEETYVSLMKEELLLDRGLHSMSFARNAEMEKVRRALAEVREDE